MKRTKNKAKITNKTPLKRIGILTEKLPSIVARMIPITEPI